MVRFYTFQNLRQDTYENEPNIKLSLTLFEFWVFLVDYIKFAFAAHNFAISRTLFN
jgi:hypothetical protein